MLEREIVAAIKRYLLIDNHVVCHDSIFLPAIINHQFHYTIKVDQSVKKT